MKTPSIKGFSFLGNDDGIQTTFLQVHTWWHPENMINSVSLLKCMKCRVELLATHPKLKCQQKWMKIDHNIKINHNTFSGKSLVICIQKV